MTTVMYQNKVIGTIDNGVFEKHVRGSIHRLHKPPAWAIDANAFDNQVKPACTHILIIDIEGEPPQRYWCTVELFEKHRFVIDRSFGKQYALPLNLWASRKPVEQARLL